MDKYVCGPCGYVYDPAEGDPDNGIDPGTSFEDLPDDWECPICGAEKADFDKEQNYPQLKLKIGNRAGSFSARFSYERVSNAPFSC